MVRHDADGVKLNAEPLGHDCQAIRKDLAGLRRWQKEELPLGAPASNEVGGPGENLARQTHPHILESRGPKLRNNFGKF
jgi:hypothetical protein